MKDYIFETCRTISDLIVNSEEKKAREELIKLLDYHETEQIEYTPIVNHLIRETGLYPYIRTETADWTDKFVYEAFKVNTSDKEKKTLHREQSLLLKKLIEGKDIAVSAPTSFGKSFVIDAFITLKKPNSVVLIVPTIALTDETRRRLYKKFASKYKIITTPEVELGEKNIFIFPQERAISYIEKISHIDILIIDEFYKAGIAFDKDRAPILLKAILELGKKAKQKYFLAPNITEIKDNPITQGMEFIPLDFHTVFSDIYETYKEIDEIKDETKAKKMLEILESKTTKSLIYAGTFNNIDTITNILKDNIQEKKNELLNNFSDWLKINYNQHYILADIVKKGVGIHNGKLHRSLSQIQVKLFEEENGLDIIVSTSSIIEGVNTSAENVIIWANKNGNARLNNFTYKNIIGRGGRMFKHFIGKIYLFEQPPKQESTQLKLEFTDDLIHSLDIDKFKSDLTREQEIKIIAFNDEMDHILGKGVYYQMLRNNMFQTISPSRLKSLALEMKDNPNDWSRLAYLNSSNPNDWEQNLYTIFRQIGGLSATHTDMITFIKVISQNWNKTIPQILPYLQIQSNGVTIEKFFEMERDVSFKVATMLKDVNLLYNHLFHNEVDISPFIAKVSCVFLPRLVYELEEYGLPRMISKKIQIAGVLDLENAKTSIHTVIDQFNEIGKQTLKKKVHDLHPFELYILDYFYDGIKN